MSGAAKMAPALTGPILVVEDDAQVRQTIAWTFEAEGLPVAAAPTGRRALELAAEERPSLLVLDLGLPDIDGYGVADGIRAVHGAVPILVITADGHAEEKAKRVGAFGYLHKPFDLDELVDLALKALGR